MLRLGIARLDLQPGDILVVKVKGILSPGIAEQIKKAIGKGTGLSRCLILEEGCDLAILSAAEIEQASTISRNDDQAGGTRS